MRPILTFLSDFGLADPYVAAVKGVVLSGCPEATIVDISHQVGPQDVRTGALVLREACGAFPAGTCHLAVVDPGVGTERAALLVRTDRYTFVGPDNGLLAPALSGETGVRVFRIRPDWPVPSTTFHGRDVFAPAVARSLAGAGLEDVLIPSPAYEPLDLPEPVALPILGGAAARWEAAILRVDGFGNLVTNITRAAFGERLARGRFELRLRPGRVVSRIAATYHAMAAGELTAIWGSSGTLEISTRDGSAARLSEAPGAGDRFEVVIFEGGAK